jgi:prolyl-tRNA synthetase
VPRAQLAAQVAEMLQAIQATMYEKALAFRQANTHEPKSYDELRQVVEDGFALAWWCGSAECEDKVKDDTKATTRCIPFEGQSSEMGRCVVCGQSAREKAVFAKAY